MEHQEAFVHWFTWLDMSPEQAASQYHHPVAVIRPYETELYHRAHTDIATGRGADNPLTVFWADHPEVPGHVVTVEKPITGDMDMFAVATFNTLCGSAFGLYKRRELTYDVYELSYLLVFVLGPVWVLDAAKTKLVLHRGDDHPTDPLTVPGKRELFTPTQV